MTANEVKMNITELARQAGFQSAEFWPDDFKGLHGCVERFAALIIEAHTKELLAGSGEPVAWLDKKHLAELQGCNGMSVWAESPHIHDPSPTSGGPTPDTLIDVYTADQMAAAVLRERERCAQIADDQKARSKEAAEKTKRATDERIYYGAAQTAGWIAAAIRKGDSHD